jgi:hypothetical protein
MNYDPPDSENNNFVFSWNLLHVVRVKSVIFTSKNSSTSRRMISF